MKYCEKYIFHISVPKLLNYHRNIRWKNNIKFFHYCNVYSQSINYLRKFFIFFPNNNTSLSAKIGGGVIYGLGNCILLHELITKTQNYTVTKYFISP